MVTTLTNQIITLHCSILILYIPFLSQLIQLYCWHLYQCHDTVSCTADICINVMTMFVCSVDICINIMTMFVYTVDICINVMTMFVCSVDICINVMTMFVYTNDICINVRSLSAVLLTFVSMSGLCCLHCWHLYQFHDTVSCTADICINVMTLSVVLLASVSMS